MESPPTIFLVLAGIGALGLLLMTAITPFLLRVTTALEAFGIVAESSGRDFRRASAVPRRLSADFDSRFRRLPARRCAASGQAALTCRIASLNRLDKSVQPISAEGRQRLCSEIAHSFVREVGEQVTERRRLHQAEAGTPHFLKNALTA